MLLELVLHAFQRGETAEDIVNSYSTLRVDDVISVIRRYLANPAPFEDYLRDCDERAEVIRRKIEASQRPQITREELLARAKAKGLIS